ncbi:MAG: PAS domain-containing protein [Gemmatimonadota bacterium]
MSQQLEQVMDRLDLHALFAGPGEIRAACRAIDWAATPLGPTTGWSRSLRQVVRMMLSTGNPMLVFWGPELVQFMNDAFLPSLGANVSPKDALGVPAAKFWAEVWAHRGPQIQHVLNGGEPERHDDTLIPITRNGRQEEVWWSYSDSPLHDDDGQIVGVLVVSQETTARVQVERSQAAALETISAERRRLYEVFRQAPAFLALIEGKEHVFRFANDAYYDLVGERELIDKPVFEALPDARDQGFEAVLDHVLATGETFEGKGVPVRLARRPGQPIEERFIDISYTAMTDADGTPSGIIAHGVDVTEQVLARDKLAAGERQLRTLADAIPTLAWTARADGYIEWYNAQWYQYTGTTPEQMEGWGWQSVHDPAVLPAVRERWQASLDTGEAFEMTFPLRGADGTFQSFLTRVVPSRDADGTVVQWFGTNTNIDAEQRLRRSAEQANVAKSEFLAVMSHELRTPLAAIDGYTRLMEMGVRGPLTDEQRHDLVRIRNCSTHLLGLINGVLNFAQLEAGALQYDVEPVAIEEVLQRCDALTEPQVAAKGLELRRMPCDPAVAVLADREKLTQTLLNLLSNAVKFTEPGGVIDVRCALASDDAGQTLQVIVADTGIGIDASEFERIFEPFVQVNAKLTRAQEGTGLGLAISRELARGMGGELHVVSVPGEGSTFTLTLRMA